MNGKRLERKTRYRELAKKKKSFGDYKADGNVWTTLTTGRERL